MIACLLLLLWLLSLLPQPPQTYTVDVGLITCTFMTPNSVVCTSDVPGFP